MEVVYIVIFVAAVWLYVCWSCYCTYRKDPTVVSRTVSAATPTSSTPSTSAENTVVAPRDGRLKPGVLLLLPVFVFSTIASGEKLECAVCLTEFKDGDKCRTMPGCGHRFHKDCIDVWFDTHSTCPVCRAAVDSDGRDRGGTYGSELNV